MTFSRLVNNWSNIFSPRLAQAGEVSSRSGEGEKNVQRVMDEDSRFGGTSERSNVIVDIGAK